MKAGRIPLIPTLLLLLAVGVMIALGVWQLRRAEWKEALLVRAAHNLIEPAIDLPGRLPPGLDYRRFRVVCDRLVFDHGPTAGTGRGGATGWLQTATCLRDAGHDLAIGLGITERPDRLTIAGTDNVFWGRVLHRGTKTENDYILYSERPLTGLIPVAQPTPEMTGMTTPEGHRGYAIQWFLFAGVAVVIYILALVKKWKQPDRA